MANATEIVDPLKKESNSSNSKETEPEFKTDSTSVKEESSSSQEELSKREDFELTSENNEDESDNLFVPVNDNYYESQEEGEESSQSMISYNFLYYLLQKFKLSNSFGY